MCTQCCESGECFGKVKRIPTLPTIVRNTVSIGVGARVRRHIEEAREEIERETENARKEEEI